MDSALNAGHFHEVASITRVLNDVKKKLIEEKDHMEDDPNADINDLELGEKVGSGGFGEVFRGRYQGVRSSEVFFKTKLNVFLDTLILSIFL